MRRLLLLGAVALAAALTTGILLQTARSTAPAVAVGSPPPLALTAADPAARPEPHWTLPAPPPGPRFLIGRVRGSLRTAAGTVPGHTPLGSQTVLLIVRHHGHTGWAMVPGDVRPHLERVDLRDLVLRWTRVAIRIDLADLTMTLRDGTQVLAGWPVAAGRPESPTPTGTFSVTDRVAFTQGGPYGDFALGLSARQTVGLPAGWSGGDQIAIHGTDHPSSIGSYASLGCIRVGEQALAVLRRTVPLGAPVTIA